MKKISGVYKIENIITGDFYIGSSKDVKRRWAAHKCPSSWKHLPNSPMYKDMQKYGIENFQLTILCEVEPEQLTVMEQKMIQGLCPTYNKNNAYVIGVRRGREDNIDYMRIRRQSGKGRKTDIKARRKYNNQLCFYNGEIVTLNTLSARFYRAGIKHPTLEAKKYLMNKTRSNKNGKKD